MRTISLRYLWQFQQWCQLLGKAVDCSQYKDEHSFHISWKRISSCWRMLLAGQIGQDTFQVLQRWSLWWCVCTCSTYVTFVIYVWLKSTLEVHVAFWLEIHCRLSPLCFTTVWHMFFVIVFCWNFRFSKAAVLEVLYLVVFVVQCSFCGCILVCCTYKTISKYDVCCQFC